MNVFKGVLNGHAVDFIDVFKEGLRTDRKKCDLEMSSRDMKTRKSFRKLVLIWMFYSRNPWHLGAKQMSKILGGCCNFE